MKLARIGIAIGCMAVLMPTVSAKAIKVRFVSESQRSANSNTKISVEAESGDGNGFEVTCISTNYSTVWCITSDRIDVPAGTGGYSLDFEIFADRDWRKCRWYGPWDNVITWYDDKGERLSVQPFEPAFHKQSFVRFRFSGEVPKKAASVTVGFGAGSPRLRFGEKVIVRNTEFTPIPQGDAIPAKIVCDVTPPLVYSRFGSPSPDPSQTVKYEVVDDGEIDWDSVTVSNAVTKAVVPFARNGNMLTLQPGRPWPSSIQALTVSVCDKAGNATLSHKTFLVGDRPTSISVQLRDDGMALVDGKPFFPIGLYSVARHEFNGFDFDRAVGNLKRAGVNFLHSYGDGRNDGFLNAVAKHGLMSFTYAFDAARGDGWIVEKAKKDRSILAWYTGDDTSAHVTPSELLDRDEAVRMLDGTRISCQADGPCGYLRKSLYQPYVAFSDVYMPELYHVRTSTYPDKDCIAEVICDMEKVREEAVKYGCGKPRAIWPILQTFHGNFKVWPRYPTSDEVYGTSFAALIHGGNGIIWFKYGGEIVTGKSRYSGAFRTAETWTAFTNLTTRISFLSPILLERTPEQPAKPEVLEGEKTDKYGRGSVSVLVKKHGDSTYVLTVNSSCREVKARIFASLPDGEGVALWEGRRVKVSGGAIEDVFKGFGVHVYRFGN